MDNNYKENEVQNWIKENGDFMDSPELLIIFKLLMARERQIREQLYNLESELQTKNRFFPENRILRSIDGLIDAPHRILEKGTYIYRARKIDKYRENEIFKNFYKDIYRVIKEQIPDFDENAGNFEWIKVIYHARKKGGKFLSDEKMNQIRQKYGRPDWWGYNAKESDAPAKGQSNAGRINPNGISYLYAADNLKTATLEVRPVISQFVSIAEVEILEDIKLFDFTTNYSIENAPKYADQSMDLTVLGEFFSQPNYSGETGYLATQYISEYIKHLKSKDGKHIFDGLCYKSSLDSDGLNYVLFNVDEDRKYVINNSLVAQVMDLLGNIEVQLPLSENVEFL